jgi:hypothetical protein
MLVNGADASQRGTKGGTSSIVYYIQKIQVESTVLLHTIVTSLYM